jgi:hypothetical protein
VLKIPTVFVSAASERVKAGTASGAVTVNVNVRVALPAAFVAVIV